MKWPLYEEVESFLYRLHGESTVFEAVMPYYGYLVYFLFLIVIGKNIFYTPIKLLGKKNKKENFWEQYKTGGI